MGTATPSDRDRRVRVLPPTPAATKDLSAGVPCQEDALMSNLHRALLFSTSLEDVPAAASQVRTPLWEDDGGVSTPGAAAVTAPALLFYPGGLNAGLSVQEEEEPPLQEVATTSEATATAEQRGNAPATNVSKSGRPLRTPRHVLNELEDEESITATAMKRTRSAKSEAVGKPSSSKKKKGQRGVGDIKSPTSRTLLRMLRVGTGEATANNTSKGEAEKHIRRLAGEFTPTVALAKRYAGREALQELLSKYLGKPISFQEAVACFENPHNRGLQSTPALTDLLDGRSWPPYPDSTGQSPPVHISEDGVMEDDDTPSEHMETPAAHSSGDLTMTDHDSISGAVKSPASATEPQPSHRPLGLIVTTGSGSELQSSAPAAAAAPLLATSTPSIVDEFRPVITTGFAKAGTAFQTELDLAAYNRRSGAHKAMLELRSLQLLSHNVEPPAALVTIRKQRTDDPPPATAPVNGQPIRISLTSLRCSDILAIKPPSISLPARSGLVLTPSELLTL